MAPPMLLPFVRAIMTLRERLQGGARRGEVGSTNTQRDMIR